MRILIVEDNLRLGKLMHDGLGARGFSVDLAATLAGADDAIGSAAYDAIILDLGLPDGDGVEWLREERYDRGLPPVIIVSARDGLGDRVLGLDSGADDYLVKPIEVEELAARLRALLRRPGSRSLPVIRSGRLKFDVAARTASVDDHVIELTRREASLLELLIRRAGMVVNRSAIEQALYSFDEPVTPNAIEAIVSRLRQKLTEADQPGVLVTVRGVGYLLRDLAR